MEKSLMFSSPLRNLKQFTSDQSSPALVLDDSCLIDRDFSMSFMGKVKKVSALPNLYFLLEKEGGSFAFKRICVKTKVDEIISERFKVIVQGKVYWIRAKEMEAWSPFLRENTKNSSLDEDSDGEVEGSVHETNGTNNVDRVSESSCMNENGFECEIGNTKKASEEEPFRSEDPFGIYDILNRNKDSRELSKEDDLSHPPGFTPKMNNGEEEDIFDNGVNVEESNERVTSMPSKTDVGKQVTNEGVNAEENHKRAKSTFSNFNQPLSNVDVSLFGSNCSHKLKTEGSFLEVKDNIVKVGQTMGYNMEGCMNNIEDIISVQGECDGFQ
nr:RNA-directed DNA polymerase, eukaryota, nucleotide-binding alpha-beta plait domain protein [Tanacetum cinerariifolium]